MSEFGNKEFMIWATVSSWSCFCWLNRASPSLAAKNIINLISVLTIWWCVESSLALLEVGVCYDLLGKTLLSFVFLHFVLQNQACLLLEISLDFYFGISIPMMNMTSFFLVLVLEGLVGLRLVLSFIKKKKSHLLPEGNVSTCFLIWRWDGTTA